MRYGAPRLDDNCNGLVDETCTCSPGQVHWCFAGDPSYRNAPGCFDGIETCTELGMWGPCLGGVQAIPPDNCYLNDTSACHAITAPPYATTHLKTGTGTFSANAVPGSEVYAVQCPTGVSQCPGVTPPDELRGAPVGRVHRHLHQDGRGRRASALVVHLPALHRRAGAAHRALVGAPSPPGSRASTSTSTSTSR